MSMTRDGECVRGANQRDAMALHVGGHLGISTATFILRPHTGYQRNEKGWKDGSSLWMHVCKATPIHNVWNRMIDRCSMDQRGWHQTTSIGLLIPGDTDMLHAASIFWKHDHGADYNATYAGERLDFIKGCKRWPRIECTIGSGWWWIRYSWICICMFAL